jgi:hypothetical protein
MKEATVGDVQAQIMAMERSMHEERRRQAMRDVDAGIRRAIADVCMAAASANAMASLVIRDPIRAADAFADSQAWTMRGMLVNAGLPLEMIEGALAETRAQGEG